MSTKIVIIGADGMLGQDLTAMSRQQGLNVETLFFPKVDIRDPKNLEQNVPACDWVINCAAFTRVDDAEKERTEAYDVNAVGAGNIARLCAHRGTKFLHISTDYVFDGKKGKPYVEDDPTQPLNYYGVSKLKGEELVQASGGHALIVRTQSLYGVHGRNFVKAILRKIQSGEKTLRVVNDQISSPTYTRHLAQAVLNLLPLNKTGLVHVANSGFCSWQEFAQAIVASVGASVPVEPLTTQQLALPALRPAFSVLDTTRYTAWTGQKMPTWLIGLCEYLQDESTVERRI